MKCSEPLLQLQHLLPSIWCCKVSLLRRMMRNKHTLVLFLFPQRTCFGKVIELPPKYMLWGNSNKYTKNPCFLKILNTMFLHNFWKLSPLEWIITLPNFVVSSVGIKRVDCIYLSGGEIIYTFLYLLGLFVMADQVRYMTYSVITDACSSPDFGWAEI